MSRPSLSPPTPMKAMLVSASPDAAATVRGALESSGDVVVIAPDMPTAVSAVASERPEIVFVDVTLPGGTALAVIHHVGAGAPSVPIYVSAPVDQLAQAAEALSLGAAGLIVSPISGDAVLGAVAEVRSRRAARERMAALESARSTLTEQCELMARAVRVARSGDPKSLAETLVGLIAVATGARGVAVFHHEERGRGRPCLAAFGTALDVGERVDDATLADLATKRAASVVPLTVEDRAFGVVFVERPADTSRIADVLEFSAGLLALAQAARSALEDLPTMPRSRGLPMTTFERLLERETDVAFREGRPFTLLCVLPDGSSPVDLARLSGPLGEPGSMCGVGPQGEAYVLLSKTSIVAARALLRNIPYKGAGLASYPVDGHGAPRLLRVAEARAKDALRSPVAVHGLAPLSLGEIARVLVESPVLESRISSIFPLELGAPAAASLVEHACRQAARTAARVHVGTSGGPDLAKPARDAVGAERVRTHALQHVAPGVEVVVVLSEGGTWCLCGRRDGERLSAVHSADPLLATVLADRLERVARLSAAPPPNRGGS